MTLGNSIDDGKAARPDDLLRQWLERDRHPRLIVDHDSGIVWANDAAHDDLKRGPELRNVDGALVAPNPAHRMLLAPFLARCGPTLTSVVLPAENNDGYILLHAHEIADPGGRRHVGLAIVRADSKFRAEYANLDKAFRLTAKEVEVVLTMINGHTPNAVAAALGITVDTARSHIRQIYAKLGVSSREMLFWRVQPFRL